MKPPPETQSLELDVTACANTGLPLDMELLDSIEYGVWLDRMNQISNEEIEAMAEAAF